MVTLFSGGKLQEAQVVIESNIVPSKGYWFSIPARGMSMQTRFTLEAVKWIDLDQDYPLTYSFFLTDLPLGK
jgi:hypothetical protein